MSPMLLKGMDMKLRRIFPFLLVGILALGLVGCGDKTSTEETAETQPTAEAQTVAEEAAPAAEEKTLSAADEKALADGFTCKYISSYYTNLYDAMYQANNNAGGTITLLADTVDTETGDIPTVKFRTTIIIASSEGNSFRVYRADGQTGEMLIMTDGFVTLKNCTFDGSSTSPTTAPAIRVSDWARQTFGKGFTLVNCDSDGSGASSAALAASAVSVSGVDAYLTLEAGSAINDCDASGAALSAIVSSQGVITNNGATFSGNTSATAANPNYTDFDGTSKYAGTEIGS
ncbi:MAG: hypothetical protein HGA54_00330 [Actinobacteria bacterium]|nr:hypothetical protein [Actinomycetota bacterium]